MSKSNGHATNGKAKKTKSRIETIGETPAEEAPAAPEESAVSSPSLPADSNPASGVNHGGDTAAAPAPVMTEWEQVHYDAIKDKEREVAELEGNYLCEKERAGESKKAFEAADKALRHLICE